MFGEVWFRRLTALILIVAFLFTISPEIKAAPGDPDATFGTGGEVKFIYRWSQSELRSNGYHHAVAIQSNGKIVVAGSAENDSGNLDFAAARLNSNGSLDTSFSVDGKATFAVGGGDDEVLSVAVSPTTGKSFSPVTARTTTISVPDIISRSPAITPAARSTRRFRRR